jgi:hypothetical protein
MDRKVLLTNLKVQLAREKVSTILLEQVQGIDQGID